MSNPNPNENNNNNGPSRSISSGVLSKMVQGMQRLNRIFILQASTSIRPQRRFDLTTPGPVPSASSSRENQGGNNVNIPEVIEISDSSDDEEGRLVIDETPRHDENIEDERNLEAETDQNVQVQPNVVVEEQAEPLPEENLESDPYLNYAQLTPSNTPPPPMITPPATPEQGEDRMRPGAAPPPREQPMHNFLSAGGPSNSGNPSYPMSRFQQEMLREREIRMILERERMAANRRACWERPNDLQRFRPQPQAPAVDNSSTASAFQRRNSFYGNDFLLSNNTSSSALYHGPPPPYSPSASSCNVNAPHYCGALPCNNANPFGAPPPVFPTPGSGYPFGSVSAAVGNYSLTNNSNVRGERFPGMPLGTPRSALGTGNNPMDDFITPQSAMGLPHGTRMGSNMGSMQQSNMSCMHQSNMTQCSMSGIPQSTIGGMSQSCNMGMPFDFQGLNASRSAPTKSKPLLTRLCKRSRTPKPRRPKNCHSNRNMAASSTGGVPSIGNIEAPVPTPPDMNHQRDDRGVTNNQVQSRSEARGRPLEDNNNGNGGEIPVLQLSPYITAHEAMLRVEAIGLEATQKEINDFAALIEASRLFTASFQAPRATGTGEQKPQSNAADNGAQAATGNMDPPMVVNEHNWDGGNRLETVNESEEAEHNGGDEETGNQNPSDDGDNEGPTNNNN